MTSIAAATALLMTAAAVVVPAAASAAPWMQVSCQNPDGSPAPSEGWSGGAVGNVSLGSTNNTNCAPGTPMYAALAMPAPAADGSSEFIAYTPPAGSRLVGGSLLVGLQANGYGFRAAATAAMFTPAYVYDASQRLLAVRRDPRGLPERPVGVLRRRQPAGQPWRQPVPRRRLRRPTPPARLQHRRQPRRLVLRRCRVGEPAALKRRSADRRGLPRQPARHPRARHREPRVHSRRPGPRRLQGRSHDRDQGGLQPDAEHELRQVRARRHRHRQRRADVRATSSLARRARRSTFPSARRRSSTARTS